ncbi:quinon protein alcohol dehydrogenase-like superfamily [Xylogone sp. PMI_703]|nr:quinon protein alcohol dehydrogenase-like superfamily [Xylogone sp. PMI_703]
MRSFLKAALALPVARSVVAQEWSGWGGNIYNNRVASADVKVNSSSLSLLVPQCQVNHAVGISATPVISGTTVYYPTWSGEFIALDYLTCETVWRINVTDIVTDFAPIEGTAVVTHPISRTSPAIDGDVLYFGTQTHALLVAVDANSGTVLGLQQVSSHPQAILTQSPTVFDGRIFIGVASQEEGAAIDFPDYPCCSFIGSMTSWTFDRSGATFSLVWSQAMLPNNTEWSGVAVWGSQPAIDVGRRQVFIGTGNTYTAPVEFEKCVNETADSCLPEDVLQESIIAFDIDSGSINWIQRIGPDADFGMAPSFVPGPNGNTAEDAIVVGQKSGALHQFNAETGQILWSTQVTPGGLEGGLTWGLAVDSSQVYFTAVNYQNTSWQLMPSGQAIQNSAYGAADLRTGKVLWETQVPQNNIALNPPSVVSDLVIVTRSGDNSADSINTRGGLVMLDQTSGEIILDLQLGAYAHSGVAAYDRFLFFGTGYTDFDGEGTLYVYQITNSSSDVCVLGEGQDNFSGLCSFSCNFGYCPSPCTCTTYGAQIPPPTANDVVGYPVAAVGGDPDYVALCSFTCARGYCPDGACTTDEAASSIETNDVCVAGVALIPNQAGLCSFTCNFGYCPPQVCVCTAYEAQIPPPPITDQNGVPLPGEDASYLGLCSYACNHGYCPPGACTLAS